MGKNSVRTSFTWIAAFAFMAAVSSSCGHTTEHSDQIKPSTTASAFPSSTPHPPLSIEWDVSGSLTGEAKDFAQFAAETRSDQYKFLNADSFSSDLLNRYNARVDAADETSRDAWQDWHTGIPVTGGLLMRAIDSTPAGDGQRITVCEYNTPGVFDVVDGKLKLDSNKRVFGSGTMTVSSTVQPSAADSHTSEIPRLLVVSFKFGEDQDAADRCEKAIPEPFVQTTPSTTTPTK
ncbi:hypothetical protein K7711_02800 [Nocardia sp. CA2R105]|uniref:hypothetical protein n=1 Tax=Nocardia coffeae TaxID=2873381 RepID=UPI001CA71D9F|nr:hypothetical protein [Nocardia coffeae]MBY8855396.1 hypothetical protein [Nocardia coffeae]